MQQHNAGCDRVSRRHIRSRVMLQAYPCQLTGKRQAGYCCTACSNGTPCSVCCACRYTSKVTLHPPHKVSSTVADSALFHHLESIWQMTPGPSPNSTWLSFSVDFAFFNPLYANVAQLFFSEVVTRMMGAFEGRCKQLYGQPSFMAPGRSQPHHVHHVPAGKQRHQQQQHGQHSIQHQQTVAAVAADAGGVAAADEALSVQKQQQQLSHRVHREGQPANQG